MIQPTEQPSTPAPAAPAAPTAPSAAGAQPASAQPAGAQGEPPIVRIILAAGKIIYQPQMSKHIIDVLGASQNGKLGVHQATLLVLNILKQKGMPPQVMDRVAPMVASLIIELGIHAGVLNEADFPKSAAGNEAGAPAEAEGAGEKSAPSGGLVATGMGG